MTLRKCSVVRKRNGKKRVGRGYSRGELKKAGINFSQALHIGLPVDVRRRTVHDENVELVKQQLQKFKIVKKRVSKAKGKTS